MMSTTETQATRCVGRGRGRGRNVQVEQVLLPKEESQVQMPVISDDNSSVISEKSVTDNGTTNGSKENRELREFIFKPSGDKINKEQFWIESQMLSLTAIPHASNEVLEEADVQLYNEQIFGDTGDPLPSTKPELPTKIVPLSPGRYYLHTDGLVHLPKNVELDTRLLYIDEQDVLYMRCYDEDQPGDKKLFGSFQKLQAAMNSYYSKLFNQGQTFIGKNDWLPEIDEIVVVRIKRLASRDHERCGFVTTTDYHRAVVKELCKDGLTVELIDDYGIGGIGFGDIYMILSKFTALPPQMFHCELEEMGLVSQRYLIRTIVRDCPIDDIWPDCLLNYVGTTWLGNRSDTGRPLVDVRIQLKSSTRLDRFITLKGHVFQNLQYALTPFVHLVENGLCKVLDCNEQGFMWVTFESDNVLARRMRNTLDLLLDAYISMCSLSNLIVQRICPEDDPVRREKNMKKMYVTYLPDTDGKLFRVKIKSVNPRTQRVRVYCVDDHMEYEVNARTMLPLKCLYPDLAQITPLVFKVHLHAIKSLQKDDPRVRSVMSGPVVLKLVHEWPKNVFPPEVYITMKGDKSIPQEMLVPEKGYEEKTVLAGCCKWFVELKLAAALSNEEMAMLNKKIEKMAQKLQEEEEQGRDKSLDSIEEEKKMKALERLGSQTFMGESYKFLWDGFHVEIGSSVSSESSSDSDITVKTARRVTVDTEQVQVQ